LEAHDRWLAWSGTVRGRSEGQRLWARYHRQAGDAGKAGEHAERALAHATEPRQPLALLAAHRMLGELATDAGRFTDGLAHLEQSLALADVCAAPFERALTLLALAELHAAAGRPMEAGASLDEIRAICAPLGAKPTLDRADALAARLAAMEDTPPAYPAGLSAREVEVLRLVAAGRSNRAIADALFLAPGTVGIHVTHILAKTNTTNRTEAAAFARDHGLA
jgi:DNA-binding CsgD family transcriptional regulator